MLKNFLKNHYFEINENFMAINEELIALVKDNRNELLHLIKQMKYKNVRVGNYSYDQLKLLAALIELEVETK